MAVSVSVGVVVVVRVNFHHHESIVKGFRVKSKVCQSVEDEDKKNFVGWAAGTGRLIAG